MIATRLLFTGAMLLSVSVARPTAVRDTLSAADAIVHAGDQGIASRPPAAWASADPADSLYKAAREALNRNDYRRAAQLFADVANRYPQSTYAPDALYWRAFALYSNGREVDLRDALRALATQKDRYPKAATIADADVLAVRIRGQLARRGDAASAEAIASQASNASKCVSVDDEGDSENDMRAAALNALLQMDAESAVPILKQVMQKRDACSASLRRKALFLLSQKQTAETESLMMDAAKNDPEPKVREQAVFWLGQVHTEKAYDYLEQLATSSQDIALREKAVFALSQQNTPRADALVRRLANSADTPKAVRDQAIFFLGQRPSKENAEALRTMFANLKGENNEDARKSVLFSLSQMRGVGNDRWLLDVANDPSQSVELRKHALWSAGQAGVSPTELVGLYNRLTDRPMKEQLIWVLSESSDRAATDKLIDVAQHDKDMEMRKKALFWLGQKNDPRVRQLLLDILNKP